MTCCNSKVSHITRLHLVTLACFHALPFAVCEEPWHPVAGFDQCVQRRRGYSHFSSVIGCSEVRHCIFAYFLNKKCIGESRTQKCQLNLKSWNTHEILTTHDSQLWGGPDFGDHNGYWWCLCRRPSLELWEICIFVIVVIHILLTFRDRINEQVKVSWRHSAWTLTCTSSYSWTVRGAFARDASISEVLCQPGFTICQFCMTL